jgi:hemerythrin
MPFAIPLSIKLLFVSVAYSLPIFTLLYFMYEDRETKITAVQSELHGIAYLKKINSIHTNLIQSKEADLSARFEELIEDQALRSILSVWDANLNEAGLKGHSPESLALEYQAAKNAESAQLIANLQLKLSNLESYVGDTSGLILDPDLDSYYLISNYLTLMPRIVRSLHRFSKSSPPDFEILDELAIDLNQFAKGVQTAVTSDSMFYGENDLLQNEFSNKAREFVARVASTKAEFESKSSNAESIISSIMSDAYSLQNDALVCVASLLHQRIKSIMAVFYRNLQLVLLSWLFCGVFVVLLQKSILRSIKSITERLNEINTRILEGIVKLEQSAQHSALISAEEVSALGKSLSSVSQVRLLSGRLSTQTKAAMHTTQSTLDRTKNGEKTMSDMSDAMDDITATNTRLKDISRIIDDIAAKTTVINDIVFKTQLLAVNAAIEAARAGHHGKGFSVVANEVGNLASMSGDAATQIRSLINQSKSQVNVIVEDTAACISAGQSVAKNAKEIFAIISAEVNSIRNNVSSMAVDFEQQLDSIEQISEKLKIINDTANISSKYAQDAATMSNGMYVQTMGLAGVGSALRYVVFGSDRPANKQALSVIDDASLFDRQLTRGSEPVAAEPAKARQIEEFSTPTVASVEEAGKFLSKVVSKRDSEPFAVDPKTSKFSWHAGLDIGVEAMNGEHKTLLRLMASLEHSYQNNKPFEEQLEILNELAKFTISHFRDEEEFMESIRYPDFENHKLIHCNLLDRLNSFVSKMKLEGQLNHEFFGFLSAWLTAHIMSVDIKYGQYSQSKAA